MKKSPRPQKKNSPAASARPLRLEYVQAKSLSANPNNWRTHPDGQLKAIKNVLDDKEVGWAGALTYNERTKRLVDGHGRLKVVAPDDYVPVLVGSWSESAEKKILATLDPLAAMAGTDVAALQFLLADVQLHGDDLADLTSALKDLLPREKAVATAAPVTIAPQWKIIIDCDSETQQAELSEEFIRRDLKFTTPSA